MFSLLLHCFLLLFFVNFPTAVLDFDTLVRVYSLSHHRCCVAFLFLGLELPTPRLSKSLVHTAVSGRYVHSIEAVTRTLGLLCAWSRVAAVVSLGLFLFCASASFQLRIFCCNSR